MTSPLTNGINSAHTESLISLPGQKYSTRVDAFSLLGKYTLSVTTQWEEGHVRKLAYGLLQTLPVVFIIFFIIQLCIPTTSL